MRTGSRVLEVALYAGAGFSLLVAALWMLGPNGLGVVFMGDLPDWLQSALWSRGAMDWTSSGPVVWASPEGYGDELFALMHEINGTGGSTDQGAPEGYAEFLIQTNAQLYDPSLLQKLAYVALEGGTALVIAVVFVVLARMVASARSESPFTLAGARRIQAFGWLLLVGAPLADLLRWAVLDWMLATSSIADRVASSPPFSVAGLPFGVMVTGAALVVLAHVWREGVRLAEDSRGLV